MSGDDFDGAAFFDCFEDQGLLTHTHPMEAVECFLDAMHPDPIEDHCPVTVYAFKHKVPSQRNLRILATHAVDGIVDSLGCDEELGGPDGEPVINPGGIERMQDELVTIVGRALRDHGDVWACVRCGQRTYSLDEIRTEFPDWFEEDNEP